MKIYDNGTYRDMTADEIAEQEKHFQVTPKQRIAELKQHLADTDFEILKVVEGATTLTKIAHIIKQRAEWRAEINRLENEVK